MYAAELSDVSPACAIYAPSSDGDRPAAVTRLVDVPLGRSLHRFDASGLQEEDGMRAYTEEREPQAVAVERAWAAVMSLFDRPESVLAVVRRRARRPLDAPVPVGSRVPTLPPSHIHTRTHSCESGRTVSATHRTAPRTGDPRRLLWRSAVSRTVCEVVRGAAPRRHDAQRPGGDHRDGVHPRRYRRPDARLLHHRRDRHRAAVSRSSSRRARAASHLSQTRLLTLPSPREATLARGGPGGDPRAGGRQGDRSQVQPARARRRLLELS